MGFSNATDPQSLERRLEVLRTTRPELAAKLPPLQGRPLTESALLPSAPSRGLAWEKLPPPSPREGRGAAWLDHSSGSECDEAMVMDEAMAATIAPPMEQAVGATARGPASVSGGGGGGGVGQTPAAPAPAPAPAPPPAAGTAGGLSKRNLLSPMEMMGSAMTKTSKLLGNVFHSQATNQVHVVKDGSGGGGGGERPSMTRR